MGWFQYAWGNGRIIVLLVVFGVLLIAYGAVQAWLPDSNDSSQSSNAAEYLLRGIVHILRVRGDDSADLLYS